MGIEIQINDLEDMCDLMCNNSFQSDCEDWVEKCMKCVHCYKRKDDDDTLYCRCRTGCHFKEVKENI